MINLIHKLGKWKNSKSPFPFSLILFTFTLFTACPDPPETTVDCGTHQVEINGTCECEDGYHWNENQTECLMDTTSHNFIWSVDTLCYWGYLEDVAIIDENNIWVVGTILTDSTTYNAAHWDGNEWELILISPGGLINPISSIYAISENDIWFGKMGLPIHWDGEIYYKYTPANSTHPGQPTINAIWGSSSDNIYFVGNNGSIVHYDGSVFETIESGTEDNINDIWGSTNSKTGETTVYCVVTTLYEETEKRLLQINSNMTVTDALDYNLGRSLMAVWFDQNSPVYVGGAGFFQHTDEDGGWETVPDLPEYFIWDIDGNNTNDIITVGAYGFVAHYNGLSWKVLDELQPYSSFRSVDINDDVVAIIGRVANIVLIGHRLYLLE